MNMQLMHQLGVSSIDRQTGDLNIVGYLEMGATAHHPSASLSFTSSTPVGCRRFTMSRIRPRRSALVYSYHSLRDIRHHVHQQPPQPPDSPPNKSTNCVHVRAVKGMHLMLFADIALNLARAPTNRKSHVVVQQKIFVAVGEFVTHLKVADRKRSEPFAIHVK